MTVADTNAISDSPLTNYDQEILKEWDYDTNKTIGFYPENFTIKSRVKVFWVCSINSKHTWKNSPRDQWRRKNKCKECNNLVEHNFISNTLPVLYSALISEWDYDKNFQLGLYPRKTNFGSKKEAYWLCEKQHSWKAPIRSRTVLGNGCPVCANRKIVSGYNDLAHTFPALLEEWDYEKNNTIGLKPTDVSYGSRIKAYWLCEKNHSWFTRISHRAIGQTGCPSCNIGSVSKIEKEIMTLIGIAPQTIITTQQWCTSGNKAHCDGVYTEKKIVVEYDGYYWHKEKMHTDIDKTKALIETGYQVIRIREKGLKSIAHIINSDKYHEITNVYPYDTSKTIDMIHIVSTVHEIMGIYNTFDSTDFFINNKNYIGDIALI